LLAANALEGQVPTGRGGGAPVQGAEPDIEVLTRFDRDRAYPSSVPLYDPATLRTIFIDFEHPDWEQEIEAFYHTAFSQEFARENFGTPGGTRWKSPNNSVGGGLSYLGDSIAPYRKWYEQKGKDDTVAWRKLVTMTKVLNETPVDQLEQALSPLLDVDATLKYLALDVALVNGDGCWGDGSDFNLYLSPQGRLVPFPHDANEGFRASGRGGGMPGASPDLLTTLYDPNTALRHKLLAVPALRTRHLAYIGHIAEKRLDWKRLGPIRRSEACCAAVAPGNHGGAPTLN
jgi:hypothetical protein